MTENSVVHIKSAEMKDFQRIEVAKIAPSNHMIVFAGRNAQGKSSGLNAIEAALGGHSSRDNPRPIREGATKGSVIVELDNGLTSERKYGPSGTTLTVKSADGGKHGQAKLTELIGSLGMDVSRFTSLGEREQLDTLLGVVDLPFVPAEIDAQIKVAKDERRDVSRRAKQLDAQALEYAGHAPNLPPAEISVASLLDAYSDAERANAAITRANQNINHWAEQIEALEDSLTAARQSHAAAVEEERKLPALVDAEAIRAQVDSAEETNRAIRRKQQGEQIQAQAKQAHAEAEMLTEEVDTLEARKVTGLAEAVMPIAGITFDADGLLYGGIPFSRASSAEKILVSVGIMIALKPELRSLIVRNGNDLDAEHLEELRAMAEAHDFQIFIEIVADTGTFEYTFIDGNLAA